MRQPLDRHAIVLEQEPWQRGFSPLQRGEVPGQYGQAEATLPARDSITVNPTKPYRGVIQVQGQDMTPQLSEPWARTTPVRANEGLTWLVLLEGRCTSDQRRHRLRAFKKARRFIDNAAKLGGVTPESQPQSFQDPTSEVRDARVDIEIRAGLTFVP